MHGEGISTPHVRHKGRQPLKHDFNLCYLPFFTFLCLFMPFYIFYLFEVEKGVSLAPTYPSIVIRKSNLRSSLGTKRLVELFLSFCKVCFY